MAVIYGKDAKLYYCAAGIGGTPVWTEIPGIRDLKLNTPLTEADLSTRSGGGWKATAGVLFDASIDFDLLFDTAKAAIVALETAYYARTTLGIACMSGEVAAAGSRGLWADCQVMKFDRDEGLNGVITVSVSLKPTYSANTPVWQVNA